MVFSSVVFLLYFLPIFLIVLFAVPYQLRNVVILLFSVFFYSWGAPKFIFVILGTTLLDYFLVGWMDKQTNQFRRTLALTLSVGVNLGLLFYFKYSNFFIENINALLGSAGLAPIAWTKLLLPIGISFYTFETLTYVVDVYRRVHKPLRNFWDYQLYIILFPKLIAGPIIRYHDIADQITDRRANETTDNRLTGLYRFAIGLAKKVLLANPIGVVASSVFDAPPDTYGSAGIWVGALAYTFQIYFDFSGYSDMAIGLGRMMGFQFPENFNNPYHSWSITEFWRRWHITLGSWMRNYLYIPLGGNRATSTQRVYLNLWLVFLVSGLWHGASWNFVLWGVFHGIFLVLERAFLLKILDRNRWLGVPYTFLLVVFGWVLFKVENLHNALSFMGKMLVWQTGPMPDSAMAPFWTALIVGFLGAMLALTKWGKKGQDFAYNSVHQMKGHLVMAGFSIVFFVLSISMLASSGFNPFIYFRF